VEFLELIDALHLAKSDKNVIGLFVKLGSSNLKLGQIEELMQAITDFRKSGKKTFCYAESFG
jgi:hypothetical protein